MKNIFALKIFYFPLRMFEHYIVHRQNRDANAIRYVRSMIKNIQIFTN